MSSIRHLILKPEHPSLKFRYALVPMIDKGVMLGHDQPAILQILDIPPTAEALKRVKITLTDTIFPLLKEEGYLKVKILSRSLEEKMIVCCCSFQEVIDVIRWPLHKKVA